MPSKTPVVPLVYSYVRFSTLEQRKGTGQQRQEELAEVWCQKRGYTLVKNYSDLGVSAFKGKNATEGALAEFLKCVEDGRICPGSILLVESLDRLSRQQVNKAAELFLSIVNRGITVVTLADGYEYTPDKFDFSQLVMSLAIFLRANDESKMKSQRKAASWKFKRERAKRDSSPLGAKTPRWISLKDGRYQLIPDEAEKVRAIFRDYTTGGMGLYLLSKKYGIAKPTISYWISNPVVIGTVTVRDPDGTTSELPNHYPAVVDLATWQAAQHSKRERFIERKANGRQGFVNLFAGVLADPSGKRFDITRHYGFSSYVANGMVLQCHPVELAIISKMAHKFVRIRHIPEVTPTQKLKQLDDKIAAIKNELAGESTLAEDLLPILKELRLQRQQEEEASTVVRDQVDMTLISSLTTASENDREARLALREIVRDTIDTVRITRVKNSGVWFRMVFGEIITADGTVFPFRFAYCTRCIGIIRCDGDRKGTAGFAGKPFNTEDFTPDLIAALKRLPLRHERSAARKSA